MKIAHKLTSFFKNEKPSLTAKDKKEIKVQLLMEKLRSLHEEKNSPLYIGKFTERKGLIVLDLRKLPLDEENEVGDFVFYAFFEKKNQEPSVLKSIVKYECPISDNMNESDIEVLSEVSEKLHAERKMKDSF